MPTPIVLELGSYSLVVHYRSETSGILRRSRIPWRLGHEVYAKGRVSGRTLRRAVNAIRALGRKGLRPRSALAVSTGALRDATNRSEVVRALEEELGIGVRFVGAREEASLLARGYLDLRDRVPALVADLGGGSLETVWIGDDGALLRDSLPVGVLRVFHLGLRPEGTFDEELVESWIEDCFAEASLLMADEICCTGSAAKDAARAVGRTELQRDDLTALEARARRGEVPEGSHPDRAPSLRAGLLVLRKLLDHARADRLRWLDLSLGRLFLERESRRMPAGGCRSPGTKLRELRITRLPHRSSLGPGEATERARRREDSR